MKMKAEHPRLREILRSMGWREAGDSHMSPPDGMTKTVAKGIRHRLVEQAAEGWSQPRTDNGGQPRRRLLNFKRI